MAFAMAQPTGSSIAVARAWIRRSCNARRNESEGSEWKQAPMVDDATPNVSGCSLVMARLNPATR